MSRCLPIIHRPSKSYGAMALTILSSNRVDALQSRLSRQLAAQPLQDPFAQEIINARPYAFLDDAPFEERRTNAIKNRSWLDPAEANDLAVLDPEAIQLVREQAWPVVANVDELHEQDMLYREAVPAAKPFAKMTDFRTSI